MGTGTNFWASKAAESSVTYLNEDNVYRISGQINFYQNWK